MLGTVIGIIVGAAVTILASRYYFQRSINKSLGIYGLLNLPVFEGIAPDVRKQLDFYFEGRVVTELQQIVFLVANNGERPIRDVIEPLTVTIPSEAELLDASVVHREPDGLKVDIALSPDPQKGPDVQFQFPLMNKHEFFAVKLLLNGHMNLSKSAFRVLADDLPRTIHAESLPESAIRDSSYNFEWGLAMFALFLFLIPAWVVYSAYLLRHAYPTLFPYPWATFAVSAKSLFVVIVGFAIAMLFGTIAFMALGASAFGGSFPPGKRAPFRLPKALEGTISPYGAFLVEYRMRVANRATEHSAKE